MNTLAPIRLFTYNSLKETRQRVEAFQNNYLALESDLFIFSGGPNKICQHKVFNKVCKIFVKDSAIICCKNIIREIVV